MSTATTDAQVNEIPPHHPSLREASRVWARIGLLSFGGPAGQIALMHKELVEERRWISENRFLHALNFCMLLPGPEAQQLATYIGWLLHGTRGGIIAGTLFVIPGFVVIVLLSIAYALFQHTDLLTSVFFGLKAGVLVIVIEAVIRVGRRALKNRVMLGIAATAFVALFGFNLPFPLIIVSAAAVGYFGSRAYPELFLSKRAGVAGQERAALIDHDYVQPAASASTAARTVLLWGGLWVAPLLLVGLVFGWSSIFVALWGFFSQMAVVTFGGAYAVLAYVAQQAVDTFGWLAPSEMVDGLALAETTPGPLVLVLSFVGFQAAFRATTGLDPMLAGVLGATLTTWVTFVPCFLWIFLGAPYIERLRANTALSGALAAITAAVVGVILNLALWFALHVLFGELGTLRFGPISMLVPQWQTIDLVALGISAVAGLALFRFHLGIGAVLAICGGLGVLAGMVG